MQAETSNLVSVQDSSLQRLVGLPGRRYILVGGKGGVGKTSTSQICHLAASGSLDERIFCPFLRPTLSVPPRLDGLEDTL